MYAYTHIKIFYESYWIKLKSDCIYHFPIALAANRIGFGSKSIGKGQSQSKIGLEQQDPEKFSLCVVQCSQNNFQTDREIMNIWNTHTHTTRPPRHGRGRKWQGFLTKNDRSPKAASVVAGGSRDPGTETVPQKYFNCSHCHPREISPFSK